MNESSTAYDDKGFQARALEAAVRIGLVVLLVWWCFKIIKPFMLPVLWGAIFAVALYPLFIKLQSLLGGREKLAATLIALAALALLITPIVFFSESLIRNSKTLSKRIEAGTLSIPPPSAKVKEWPLLGGRLYDSWHLASSNLDAALNQFRPQLRAVGRTLLSITAGVGAEVFRFILAIIIAAAFLVYARSGTRAMEVIAVKLVGRQDGYEVVRLTSATIRSVAQGVLGVALIQAILAGGGMMVMGVPFAGLWTLAVLVLAIVQLPTIVILGPIIIYVFSVTETTPAVLFAIWNVAVGVSDTFLKPIFLGRGMDIPMLVILLGAIGGMVLSGIIGLFVGAVALAVGYKLFTSWLDESVVLENDSAAGDVP